MFWVFALAGIIAGAAIATRKKTTPELLWKKELHGILKQRNLLQPFLEGRVKCSISGETITESNLAIIEDRGHELIFVSQGNTAEAGLLPPNNLQMVVE